MRKHFFTIFLSVSVLKIPPSIDFAVTWFALSNGFWNPFLYWLLNAHFRSISHDMITSKVSKLSAVVQCSLKILVWLNRCNLKL